MLESCPAPRVMQCSAHPAGPLIPHGTGGLIHHRVLQHPELVDGNPHDIPWLEPELSDWSQHLRTELPAHHNSSALGEAPLAIVGTKRSGATQVLQSILCY